jgi:GTPase SAR1 family protein
VAGQDRYFSISKIFVKNSRGVILMTDSSIVINEEENKRTLLKWHSLIKEEEP